MRYILSYDLGTSSVKASLIDEEACLVDAVAIEYPTYYEEGGIREQKPEEWILAMEKATRRLLDASPYKKNVAGIGISGHSLGVVAMDRSGKLVFERTPIWSDSRAVREADDFFHTVDYAEWYHATGNGFTRQLYAVFKILWYKKHFPDAYDRVCTFLGTKDYLNYYLCGVIATDPSYASGSGVYDLRSGRYREDFIRAAGLRESDFPPIRPSCEVLGFLREELALSWGLPKNVAVVCGGVDNACMTLGAGCVRNGDAYVSLGSSSWVALSSDRPENHFEKKIYIWAHVVPGLYISSSGIFSACSSLDYMVRNFFPDLAGNWRGFDELAGKSPPGSEGVLFCPVMAGGSAVDASPEMKGGLLNLDLSTRRECIARAILEGIAFDLRYSLDALSSVERIAGPVLFVGGGAASELWRQIFADIFDLDVRFGKTGRHAASLGAAALALYGIGVWKNYEKLRDVSGEITKAIPQNVAAYEKKRPVFNRVCEYCARIRDAEKEVYDGRDSL